MSSKSTLTLLWITLSLLAITASPALAHDGEPHGAQNWWAAWSLEPGVMLLLGISAAAYTRGWRAMVRRGGGASGRLKAQSWAFVAGIFVLAIALLSPLDALAGQLFWVHMLQHNLLMLAAAPLLVLAYPLPAILLGLPAEARRGLGAGWRRLEWLRAAWGIASSPAVAWLLQAVLLWGWHSPFFYQASVENDLVHAIQHFSFLGSALLFWWVTLRTYGGSRANRGLAILYLFTTALYSGLLGALLTFSERLWYPIYAGRAEAWGISALADQQLAGTIMWVPAGMVYLAAALWMMKTWLDDMEAQEAHTEPKPRFVDEELL